MNKFKNSNVARGNKAPKAVEENVGYSGNEFTPTVTLYKDNCKVIMGAINAKEWQAEGWKSDEDLKKEAEERINKAKEANKVEVNN